MSLNVLPDSADSTRDEVSQSALARLDRRDLGDPTSGKGIIMHSIRDFIQDITKKLFTWSERSSIWPLTFGIKCCAIEMMAFGAARYDSDRLGVFFRASPRQADLMIVAGPATIKLKEVILRLYEQMPEPKYVIAFGECAICGGPFFDSYSVINGVDKLIPVDVYVPGCPPRPEQLLLAIRKLQETIDQRAAGAPRSTIVVDKDDLYASETIRQKVTREKLLAEIMNHPSMNIGHQSGQQRLMPSPEEISLATPTAQPESIMSKLREQLNAKQTLQTPTGNGSLVNSSVNSPPEKDFPTKLPTQPTSNVSAVEVSTAEKTTAKTDDKKRLDDTKKTLDALKEAMQ